MMMPIVRRLAGVFQAHGDVLRSRSYFPLWLGQFLSAFGDTLHYIALVVLVFRLSGHGLPVAGLVAAEIVPVLVLGPVAGGIIDRFSRKAVLITAGLFRAMLALSLVWPQGVWHAYLVAAGPAASGTFFTPTVQAVIPSLTTERGRLAANSVAWSTVQLVQIVASALVGASSRSSARDRPSHSMRRALPPRPSSSPRCRSRGMLASLARTRKPDGAAISGTRGLVWRLPCGIASSRGSSSSRRWPPSQWGRRARSWSSSRRTSLAFHRPGSLS
jgi:MFS family permease